MTTTISEIKRFFSAKHIPAFVVGGYVRDALNGRLSQDVDFVAECDTLTVGREISDFFGGTFVLLDKNNLVVRVIIPDPDWGKISVDISPMMGSIEKDLRKRDFTIDAMALPVDDVDNLTWSDHVIDPLGGRRDLELGIINAINDDIFISDPIRLIRAVRLSAYMEFGIDNRTSDLIRRDAHLLQLASGERIRDEFMSLLAFEYAKRYLNMLDELDLLCCIIPELRYTKGVEQPNEHFWDVFQHSVETVGAVDLLMDHCGSEDIGGMYKWNDEFKFYFDEPAGDNHSRRTLLKLGALLHDIGKPKTKVVEDDGRTRFLGHSDLGAKMSSERLNSLRCSSKTKKNICGMVEHHLRPFQLAQDGDMPTSRAIYRYFRDLGDIAVEVLYLSLADYRAAKGPLLDPVQWQQRIASTDFVLTEGFLNGPIQNSPRLVTGYDLMDSFGLTPGPQVGILLDHVKEAHAIGKVRTKKEALTLARSKLCENRG